MAFDELLASPRFLRTSQWEGAGDTFLLGEAPTSLALYAASGDAVHFDLEGRWNRASLSQRRYLRGLDGAVLQRLAGVHREDLRVGPAEPVHAEVVALLERARVGAPPALLAPRGWTVARLLDERRRFLEVYRPVGVLPPDRYRSLIIQATEGCAYNGCLFCSLYKGQPFRVKSREELERHVVAVKDFVGSGVTDRRGVFLGEANALSAPQGTLLGAFDVLGQHLGALLHGRGPSRGVSAFVDAFAEWKTVAELEALAARGLQRVFLGVESGDGRTLQLLGKPSSARGVRAVVDAAKGAGLSVGLTLLVGLGPEHVDASAALVCSLGLGAEDVVYLSPLVLEEGSALERELVRRGLRLPSAQALATEDAQLRVALSGGRAQVARYDVRRFVYV